MSLEINVKNANINLSTQINFSYNSIQNSSSRSVDKVRVCSAKNLSSLSISQTVPLLNPYKISIIKKNIYIKNDFLAQTIPSFLTPITTLETLLYIFYDILFSSSISVTISLRFYDSQTSVKMIVARNNYDTIQTTLFCSL